MSDEPATLETLKPGDFAYFAKWENDVGTTRICVERHLVISCTPCGFRAQHYDTSARFDYFMRAGTKVHGISFHERNDGSFKTPFGKLTWYGYNSRKMRPTLEGSIVHLRKRTGTYHDILTKNLADCKERIRAMDSGEISFPNELRDWTDW
jgi:hypothetical protein